MPPEGRRKKKFEKEMRRVQNRNLFAALVLLIAAVATVFLVRWVLLSTKPVLFVSLNRVDHSGIRKIPFSEDSCDVITTAFRDHLDCTMGDIQELDEANSRLDLDPNITNRDILIVYLNGHLIGKSGDAGQEVYWIGPESDDDVKEMKLSDLLTSADASEAKLKIVMLDAGRYTWSPVFPGRSPNQFQSVLADKLKNDEWNLGNDFWVITSHSDYEISNVSTPLKSSLFAKSVSESLKSRELIESDEIQVRQLFAEISQRTQSYSKNFNNKSLQNPVLMHAGEGVVKSPKEFESKTESETLRVTWKKQAKPEDSDSTKKPTPPKIPLSEFAQDPDSFSKWLYRSEVYSSLPNQTIRSLERFLEFDEPADWPTSDLDKIDEYTQELNRTSRPATGRPTDFDSNELAKKRTNVRTFRRCLLEFSVMLRLRDQMRFWDDNTYKTITGTELPKRLTEPINLKDTMLTNVATSPRSIRDWIEEWEDFKKANERNLFDKVNRQLGKDAVLSPMQAELLGVVSQRYLKLLQSNPDGDETEKKDAVAGDLQITLEVDVKGRFDLGQRLDESDPGAGFKRVVHESIEELEKLRNAVSDGDSDTALRYQLAATGSEFTETKTGVVPDIAWKVIPRNIDINPVSSTGIHDVNPYDRIPVQFKIQTTVVDNIDLKISTDGPELDGLNYGFSQQFLKTVLLSDLYSANGAGQSTRTVDVFFQYPQIVADNIGKPFAFTITATDRSDPTVVDKEPFRIKITQEPTFWLSSKRKLANKGDGQRAKLFHWGDAPARDKWNSLAIRTLANVKSGFEINFQNNSDMPRSFNVKLFNIKKFPGEIPEDALRADRLEWEQVRDYSLWLKSQNVKTNEYFELIGQSSINNLKPQDSAPIVFSLPPPIDPEEKRDPEVSVAFEIGSGALVVFYDVNQPDEPAWFQMLKFETQDSANVAVANPDPFRVKKQIENIFGTDIAKLKDNLVFSAEQVAPARLTTVSKSVFANNRNGDAAVYLDDILAKDGGAGFSPDTEQALLLLDVLGVSNYATYEINGSTIELTPMRKHLTGIRVIPDQSPEGWKFNPMSWSFARTQQLASPYQWLANSGPDGVTDFFIDTSGEQKSPPGAGKQKLRLEVFLPFKHDDTLSWKKDDFWYRWILGKTNLYYPNNRGHVVEISKRGLTAWSTIRAHQIEISDLDNKVLEIGQGTQALGKWRFVTESLKIEPTISAKNSKAEASPADLKRVLIDVDIRDIKPAVAPGQITLKLNEKPVKDLAEFLKKHPHPSGSGQFQFSLFDIFSEFGDPLKQEKTTMVVEVLVTDFFGATTSDRTSITVAPKPVIKPPPKPVTVAVTFVMNKDPANLLKFSKITINKQLIPLNRATAFNDGQVKIIDNKAASSITIEGLIPGVYDLTVDAFVKPKNEGQFVPATAKGKIKVAEGEPATTLVFVQ